MVAVAVAVAVETVAGRGEKSAGILQAGRGGGVGLPPPRGTIGAVPPPAATATP